MTKTQLSTNKKKVLRWICAGLVLWMAPLPATPFGEDIQHVKSRFSVEKTVARAQRMIEEHELRWQGAIDHAEFAKRVGVKMRPAQTIHWTDVAIQTTLIKENPLVALAFPLTLFVWEDEQGTVWISYVEAKHLLSRYRIAGDKGKITRVQRLQKELSTAVAK